MKGEGMDRRNRQERDRLDDEFFKGFERKFVRAGCAAILINAAMFLFVVGVILAAIYVLVHYIL